MASTQRVGGREPEKIIKQIGMGWLHSERSQELPANTKSKAKAGNGKGHSRNDPFCEEAVDAAWLRNNHRTQKTLGQRVQVLQGVPQTMQM